MSVPSGPFYHGTNKDSAASILTNGIMQAPARHSRGHLHEDVSGFYMTPSAEYAADFDEAVVEIHFPDGGLLGSGVDILDADSHMDGARPAERPEWWREFRDWTEREVRDAAVWEVVDTDKTPEEIIQGSVDKIDPEDGDVESNQQYAEKVSRFADEMGYDMIYWNDTETVLLNFDAPERIVPYNDPAVEATEDSL